MREELKPYIKLVEFLGKCLGNNYEVFLYDLIDEDHPIIAIENSELSGRCVGSSMKNVTVKMINNSDFDSNKTDYVVRHDAISKNGKQFKSSAYLVRNAKGKAIAALCINFNIEPILNFVGFIDSLGHDLTSLQQIKLEDVIFAGEVFSNDSTSSLKRVYEAVLTSLGPVDFNNSQDRIKFLRLFFEKGGFQQKGAVSFLALELNISEPTIYRYINRFKKEKNF